MGPRGWLDVHGHFYLPQTDAERQAQIETFRESEFMVGTDWKWSISHTLQYMDSAGIQMQMLSYISRDIDTLRRANDFAAEQVQLHPARFGQLAALPTHDPVACLAEIDRATTQLNCDGFAVTACYNGVYFSDPKLETVWQKLDELNAVVHMHPNAYAGPVDGRPSPVIEVAFETTRVATDIVYRGLLNRYRNIKLILAHCGGALPVLSGRLSLLGTESWVPNLEGLTRAQVDDQLCRFYVDTAATAETGLQPALKLVGKSRVLYGDDCGVPCSTALTMDQNLQSIKRLSRELGLEDDEVGQNAWSIFPAAAARVEKHETSSDA